MKKWISLLGIGVVVAAALPVQAQAEEGAVGGSYDSKGVIQYVPKTDVTLPVDPTNPDPDNPVIPVDPTDPDGEIEPGTVGPLSIDYASSFDFGINEISNETKTYYARAQTYADSELVTPNFVQVSDNRGSNAGWTLTVKQNGDFTSEVETLNDVLTGAEISITSPTVNSNANGVAAPDAVASITLDGEGAEAKVVSAKLNAGAGTWSTYWGTVSEDEKGNDITTAVSLEVPGSTPKDAVRYVTTLTWTLSDVPGE